jgi:hypothetical protein
MVINVMAEVVEVDLMVGAMIRALLDVTIVSTGASKRMDMVDQVQVVAKAAWMNKS